ncbi:MAG: hypothetical protein Q9197_005490 [Variospora fuerteventurae]
MAVPDEESPLLQHDTPQRDSETQEDDRARSGYSSIASKHEFGSQSKGATPEDAAPDGKYGKLSDIYGRKGVLIFSYVVFAVGCATWYVVQVGEPPARLALMNG